MALPPLDPQKRQKLLLGLALVFGLAFVANQYLVSPRKTETEELQTRLDNLELQNQTARSLARGQGSSDVERRLAAYRNELQAVEQLIPSSEELPDLLDAISAEAQRTGVQLSLIQPVEATEEQYYTRRVYDVAVLGSYHNIGQFLTRIASLPRIVTPQGLTLTTLPNTPAATDSPRLEARFSIETYVITLPDSADFARS